MKKEIMKKNYGDLIGAIIFTVASIFWAIITVRAIFFFKGVAHDQGVVIAVIAGLMLIYMIAAFFAYKNHIKDNRIRQALQALENK